MPVDRRLALHEAGHAVVGYHIGIKIKEIVMCEDPALVYIEEVPHAMAWQYLLFLMAGNAVEHKINPKTGWYYTSDYDYETVRRTLEEGTGAWYPPDIAYDDDCAIEKALEYVGTFTRPAFDCLEKQAARIISIPEIWAQLESLAEVLLRVDRIDGEDVKRLLEAGKPGTDSDLPGNLR